MRTSIYRPLNFYCKLENNELLTEEYSLQGMKVKILKKIYLKALNVEDINVNEECELLLKSFI